MSNRPLTGLAVACAVLFVACAGAQTPDSVALEASYPGHLAYVGRDAQVVVSLDHIAERVQGAARSRTFARLQGALSGDSQGKLGELSALLGKVSEDVDTLAKVFGGRVTFVTYGDGVGGGLAEQELVMLIDGDAQTAVETIAQVAGEPLEMASLRPDITRFQIGGQGTEGFFTQVGAVGILADSEDALLRTRQLAGLAPSEHLSDTASFASVTTGLKVGSDVFFYMADWEGSNTGLESMVAANSPARRTKAVAATASLVEGIAVEINVQFDESDVTDAEVASVLPAMRAVTKSPTIPALLPEDTLAFVGSNVSLKDIDRAWLEKLLRSESPTFADQELASMVSELMGAFEGEFALALTGLPADGPVSALLSMPVPAVVLVGKLADPSREGTARKILDAILNGLTEGPSPTLLARRTEHAFGSQLVLYAVSEDPAIELGYAFHSGYLSLGTKTGLLAMLESDADRSRSLAKFSSHEAVGQSLTTPSNYSFHLALWGVYRALRERYGPLVAMFTEGMAGDDARPLDILLRAFPHLGGTVAFHDDVANIHVYLTAEDPP